MGWKGTKDKNPNAKKNIKSPELMWEYFCAYAEQTKLTPFMVKDWVGKDGKEIEREKEKPLTLEGFENYCCDQGIINSLQDYFGNGKGLYDAFIHVCQRIKREIRQDQIEGGMARMYDASITARLNGLVDKTESAIKVEQPLFNLPGDNKPQIEGPPIE